MRIGTFIAITLACFAACFAAGFLTGRKRAESRPVDLIRTDTVTCTIHDTILRERPVFVAKMEIRTDTVRLALVDSSHTTVVRDSVEVEVPITRKVYEEDSLYRVVVSGPRCGNYEPSLDSLVVWPTITTVTIHDTKTEYRNSKISFGIQAGYGAFGKDLSPYIGVGITYNLFSINSLKFK